MTTYALNGPAVTTDRFDDLVRHARGLALVRDILARRGATPAELDAHTRELERVQQELVATLTH